MHHNIDVSAGHNCSYQLADVLERGIAHVRIMGHDGHGADTEADAVEQCYVVARWVCDYSR